MAMKYITIMLLLFTHLLNAQTDTLVETTYEVSHVEVLDTLYWDTHVRFIKNHETDWRIHSEFLEIGEYEQHHWIYKDPITRYPINLYDHHFNPFRIENQYERICKNCRRHEEYKKVIYFKEVPLSESQFYKLKNQ